MNGYDPQAKRNFKLALEYDGSQYHGWQRQQGVLTIQEVLESRLAMILQSPVAVHASGRTDAGVHAREQVVSFNARTRLRPEELLRGLNSVLPPDIVVLRAEEAALSFHARFSTVGKIYEYHILNREVASALHRRYEWHIRQVLDAPPMVECLGAITGLHDFSAFMAAGSSVNSTERLVRRAELEKSGSDRLKFTFEANGFLRHMVRNLVGTLIEVGRKKRSPEDFVKVLEGRDRKKAGMTAPAHGLFLTAVYYSDDVCSNEIEKGGK